MKPSTRKLWTEKVMGDLVTAEKSIKKPPLFTERRVEGGMLLRYSYLKSRYKPLKRAAKATSEKIAIGWFLDGLATAVIGTHTHVQTADERILPGGTACITDVGMTGSFDSVIGVKKGHVLERFLTQMPVRFEPADGDVWLSGVVVEVDGESGKSKRIERFRTAL